MKKSFAFLSSIFVLAGLSSFAAAAGGNQASPLLSDVLSGNGEVVFLKGEHVPGLDPNGDPSYMQTVFYYENGRYLATDANRKPSPEGKLSCMIEYSTSGGTDLHPVPGQDLNISLGQKSAWAVGDLYEKQYQSIVNDNGFVQQIVNLSFDEGTGLIEINCDVAALPANSKPLTVTDFEDAFNGMVTVRAVQ